MSTRWTRPGYSLPCHVVGNALECSTQLLRTPPSRRLPLTPRNGQFDPPELTSAPLSPLTISRKSVARSLASASIVDTSRPMASSAACTSSQKRRRTSSGTPWQTTAPSYSTGGVVGLCAMSAAAAEVVASVSCVRVECAEEGPDSEVRTNAAPASSSRGNKAGLEPTGCARRAWTGPRCQTCRPSAFHRRKRRALSGSRRP